MIATLLVVAIIVTSIDLYTNRLGNSIEVENKEDSEENEKKGL
tara:strand:+ start:758 stop:886 length:129 start_codon:yes stop_codon:yes gene_type:complete